MRADNWQEYVLNDSAFVEFPPRTLVLDVGCGSGTQPRDLRQRGCVGIGIEPDWLCLVNCQNHGLNVLQAIAEELPVKTSSLDGAICKAVIPYTDECRALSEICRVLKRGAVCHFCDHGAGYYLRYLLCGPSWKFRFYGLRTLANTWVYAMTGRRSPRFLGDTVYQTRRRLAAYYRKNGLRLLQGSPSRTFLGLPVFIYHSVRKAAA